MTTIKITCSNKDNDGDITEIGNSNKTYTKSNAINKIESGNYTFKVNGETEIEVVNGSNGKYLRSKADGKSGNNLDKLKDCN